MSRIWHWRRPRFKPLVLCLHGASESWPNELSIPPDAILSHVKRLLKLGYAPASGSAVMDGGARRLHVTFDDAFRSIAGPVERLRALGVPCTVFACSGLAQTGAPLAVHTLADEVDRYPEEMRTMSWDELRAVADAGAEIGSHTVTHPFLTRLTDAELDEELGTSKRHIEDELGRPCAFLAYPFGNQDERVRAAARRAGYRAAFGLPGEQRPADEYDLPRVALYRCDTAGRALLKASRAGRVFSSARGNSMAPLDDAEPVGERSLSGAG